jgi:rod shape determining protein RodA
MLNTGMMIGLFPTTGIPLPLLSYGGSSVATTLGSIGLILSVEARRFANA